MPSKSVMETSRLVAMDAVPEFPGATNNALHNGLWDTFQAKVCSLPPAPNIKMFMIVFELICFFFPFDRIEKCLKNDF